MLFNYFIVVMFDNIFNDFTIIYTKYSRKLIIRVFLTIVTIKV